MVHGRNSRRCCAPKTTSCGTGSRIPRTLPPRAIESSWTRFAVARADFLDLRLGPSRWLKAAQILLALLGILAILVSPANWMWKLGSILLLILVSVSVHAWSAHQGRSGAIRLYPDGTAFLRTASGQEINAIQGPHGWVSRWLCVMTLCDADSRAKHHCVICASENHPDEYRRLLKFLRMRTAPAGTQGMIW